MFLGGIMFEVISKKAILVMVAVLSMLLVLEPTSGLVVTIVSLPIQITRMVLGFVLGIINWPMLVMVGLGFTVTYLAKTRTIDWAYLKGLFNKEEA
jgi:hypothetical protein